MVLFLRYVADTTKRRIEQLTFDDDHVTHVVAFLRNLENQRGVSVATRNHRLSVIKAFCRFVAYQNPLLATACQRVLGIPLKKHEQKLLDHFEPEEMEAMIDAASTAVAEGRRNRALLLLLYNTGCRASELAGIAISDVTFERPRHVRILGKGRRWRTVPLWERTAVALRQMLHDRSDKDEALFLGQRRNRITRYGVLYVVREHAKAVIDRFPELRKRRLSPHTVRHTTAVALLRATSDIDAVSKVLGHASIETTRIYTAKDRSQLAQTINSIATELLPTQSTWTPSQDVLRWLEKL
jgi:site-specific recombinase XerD